MNLENLILLTDSYKASHWLQYPPNTTNLFSYFESRGGKFDKTVFFGLQYILAKYFSKPVTQSDVEEAAAFFAVHGEPFNREGWEHIIRQHRGYLPIKIRAVPEGTVVPTHHALFTVESTDEKVPWIVSWVETILERVWYPITVATLSWHAKKIIRAALDKSSDDPAGQISFKLHDFGGRGVSSHESAGIGGAAHLINFMGSDTIEGILLANHYYDEAMAGFSIPAAEHSSITSWTKPRERDAYRNMLTQFAGKYPLVAVVSDSYDLFNAVSTIWGKELKEEVINCGSMVVIRPDSGNPPEIVLETLERLHEAFGATLNKKGYYVLNNVRVIQGDGINLESIQEILDVVLAAGYSADNIAFGMGGALLQKVDRDTLKFAYKCSSAVVDGERRDVFKAPVTDMGKVSKKGELELIYDTEDDWYFTVSRESLAGLPVDRDCEKYMFNTVYENGPKFAGEKFAVVRARAAEAQ